MEWKSEIITDITCDKLQVRENLLRSSPTQEAELEERTAQRKWGGRGAEGVLTDRAEVFLFISWFCSRNTCWLGLCSEISVTCEPRHRCEKWCDVTNVTKCDNNYHMYDARCDGERKGSAKLGKKKPRIAIVKIYAYFR